MSRAAHYLPRAAIAMRMRFTGEVFPASVFPGDTVFPESRLPGRSLPTDLLRDAESSR